MRINRKTWILGAVCVLVFVVLLVWVIKAYTTTTTEQAAPATFVGSVETVGISGGLLVAHINSPGAGSLHWENSQELVSSDTMTWEEPLVGDVELSPIGETTGLRPVLTTPQGVVKGNPLP
jgi:uncharacterized membrane-anchored protein